MIRAIEQRYSFSLFQSNTFEWKQILQNRIPQCYKPEQIYYPLKTTDKLFASCWIGEEKIAIGTKENKLCIWNICLNEVNEIQLPSTTINYNRGCGIHDIDCIHYKDNNLLLSGSDSPNDIALFETNTMKPIGLCKGHTDWVFGCKFVTNSVIFSGGKDGSIYFWKCDTALQRNDSLQLLSPYSGKTYENTKIRCVSVEKSRALCYSLNTNGSICIWDTETMMPIQNEFLDDFFELITMDVKQQDNLIAVGSRSYTSIIDPRTDSDTICINHVDSTWGVRKVLFLDNYLIIGGGSGTVSFLDMRNPSQFHHIIYHKCEGIIKNGFLDLSENEIPQAVYTISYNTSQTNLFVGGGPLLVGVEGSFGSIWN